MTSFDKYTALERQLLDLRRRLRALQDEEDALLGRMDDAWWTMTDEERERANKTKLE